MILSILGHIGVLLLAFYFILGCLYVLSNDVDDSPIPKTVGQLIKFLIFIPFSILNMTIYIFNKGFSWIYDADWKNEKIK